MNAQYVKEKKDGLGYNRGEHLKLFNYKVIIELMGIEINWKTRKKINISMTVILCDY